MLLSCFKKLFAFVVKKITGVSRPSVFFDPHSVFFIIKRSSLINRLTSLKGVLVYLVQKLTEAYPQPVAGLRLGFLAALSIGPLFFFFIQMEEKAHFEGSGFDVLSTTGFVVGQLMLFASVYCLPMHMMLRKPYRMALLLGLYLFSQFFVYEERVRWMDSRLMLSIFLVNFNVLLFYQSHFGTVTLNLAKVVNTYILECPNPIVFLISSLVGWVMTQWAFVCLCRFVFVLIAMLIDLNYF